MKLKLITALMLLVIYSHVTAQRPCLANEYRQKALLNDPPLVNKLASIEDFNSRILKNNATITMRPDQVNVITIPVVVHILYHYPSERISETQVLNQLKILNRD